MKKLHWDVLASGETRGLLMECSNSNFDQSKYFEGEFIEIENHKLGYSFQTQTTNVQTGDVYTAPYTGHK